MVVLALAVLVALVGPSLSSDRSSGIETPYALLKVQMKAGCPSKSFLRVQADRVRSRRVLRAVVSRKDVVGQFCQGKKDCVACLQENLQITIETNGNLRITFLGETAAVQNVVLNAVAECYLGEVTREQLRKAADLRGLDALLNNWQGECRRLVNLRERAMKQVASGAPAKEAKKARLKALKMQENEARNKLAELLQKKKELTDHKGDFRVFLLKRAP